MSEDIYDFESLRNNAQEIEENLIKTFAPKPKFTQDERFWKPKPNLSGNIYAEIRFMPPFKKDGYSHITKYFHSWQNPGNKKHFYIECPKTYGYDCPVCDEVVKMWKEDKPETKEERRNKNKKTNYTSVIYVVKDPEEPSNEGKFFFYTYGKTIYDRIQAKLNPESQYEESYNIFDIFTGCTLKLKGSPNEGGYMGYNKSEWMAPAPIKQDENELKELWKQYIESHLDLSEFLDASKVKSYDEIHDLYCKYENFGRSIETRISSKNTQKIEKDQNEFFGFNENDVKEIQTDTNLNTESVLDDEIPDFADINDENEPTSNSRQEKDNDFDLNDDVDNFIAQLEKQ